MVRAGLRQFLADQPDFAVVGEAANGREALDIVRQGEVDVMLLDIAMPGQNGVDALAAIRARAPTLAVLILSGHDEAHYATTLLRLGASGYLNKHCDPDELVKAVRTVARGRKYITASVAERLAEGLPSGSSDMAAQAQAKPTESISRPTSSGPPTLPSAGARPIQLKTRLSSAEFLPALLRPAGTSACASGPAVRCMVMRPALHPVPVRVAARRRNSACAAAGQLRVIWPAPASIGLSDAARQPSRPPTMPMATAADTGL